MTKKSLNCFKAYDIRGKLGEELNENITYRIGRATAQTLEAKTIVLGFDARETSPSLAQAVRNGICDFGADVFEIGLAGTEEMYFAVSEFEACAGIAVTASHNPLDYNGMKIVKKRSQPLLENEFASIKTLAENSQFVYVPENHIGSVYEKQKEAREAYINKIVSFVDLKNIKPLKIVLNSGNGTAGPVIDDLFKKIEVKGVKTDFVRVHHQPDSSFPHGIPNPLLEQNHSLTADIVVKENADFGVAFDGDFDRCFLFDHLGNFIPGEYVVGVLAQIFLNKENGGTIIHDPRVIWNTIDAVKSSGGNAISSKTGHAFVKATMRKEEAIYGGEMSAHHYFRDFAYCDSGMIPWLMIWELLSTKDVLLVDLISERRNLFPSSGEINFSVSDSLKCISKVKDYYSLNAIEFEEIDGLSMCFETWRFNLRNSNTEPLVRLNVETKGDKFLLLDKIKELKDFIVDL